MARAIIILQRSDFGLNPPLIGTMLSQRCTNVVEQRYFQWIITVQRQLFLRAARPKNVVTTRHSCVGYVFVQPRILTDVYIRRVGT